MPNRNVSTSMASKAKKQVESEQSTPEAGETSSLDAAQQTIKTLMKLGKEQGNPREGSAACCLLLDEEGGLNRNQKSRGENFARLYIPNVGSQGRGEPTLRRGARGVLRLFHYLPRLRSNLVRPGIGPPGGRFWRSWKKRRRV